MKLTGILLLTMLQLMLATASFGQSLNADNLRNVEVSTLSDEDIKTYYNKALASGFTEEQMFALAIQRGMPEVQVQKLKDRLATLNLGAGKKAGIIQTPANSNTPIKKFL